MNSYSSHRKTYGILPLTPAIIESIQLEFALVEAPAPRARFLNFPLADDAPQSAAPRSTRTPGRRQAA